MRVATRLLLLVAGALVLGVVPGYAATLHSNADLGLGDGQLGDYRWSVEAKRPQGSAGTEGARRPCLLVDTTWQIGPFSYRRSKNRQCAGTAGLSASGPPLVARGVQPSTGGQPRMTAVGMIFAPAARRVEVTLADGDTRTIRLAPVDPTDARQSGLARFRYAAFATRGEWCAERLVSRSASGRMLWDSGTDAYACGTTAPPRFESD